MSKLKVLIPLAVCFAVFAGVHSGISPRNYSSCKSICDNYLNGKTVVCDIFSAEGSKATLVVRFLTVMEMRLYVIEETKSMENFCKRVAAADELFNNKTNDCHSPLKRLYQYDSFADETNGRFRRSLDNSNELLSNFRGDNVNDLLRKVDMKVRELSAKENRKESEVTDLEKRALFPSTEADIRYIDVLINNLKKMLSISSESTISSENNVNESSISPETKQRTSRYNFLQKRVLHTAINPFDECKLCSLVLKDMCEDTKILVCNDKTCCWMKIDLTVCRQSAVDNSSETCFKNLVDTIEKAEIYAKNM